MSPAANAGMEPRARALLPLPSSRDPLKRLTDQPIPGEGEAVRRPQRRSEMGSRGARAQEEGSGQRRAVTHLRSPDGRCGFRAFQMFTCSPGTWCECMCPSNKGRPPRHSQRKLAVPSVTRGHYDAAQRMARKTRGPTAISNDEVVGLWLVP